MPSEDASQPDIGRSDYAGKRTKTITQAGRDTGSHLDSI
jgi:hypothetical protein